MFGVSTPTHDGHHPRDEYDLSNGEVAPEGECPACDHLYDFNPTAHHRAEGDA